MPSCPSCGFLHGGMKRRKDGLYECDNCHALYIDVLGIGLEPIPGFAHPRESRTCFYCGSSIAMSNSRFCSNCGAKIDEMSADISAPAERKEAIMPPEERPRPVRGATARRLPKAETACMVCKLAIAPEDVSASCPHCGNVAHEAHLLEWLHVKNHCPMCNAHLSENELKELMPKRNKRSYLKRSTGKNRLKKVELM